MEDFPTAMARLRDNSFVRDMLVDPEADRHAPNQRKREVRGGHFVPVPPTSLPAPRLVLHSPEMAAELGLTQEQCASQEFARFFSGDASSVPNSTTWATPYALSIYGVFQQNGQCPFGNGCGYGDGRAISVQEVLASSGSRWELQLKGAGRTPFCRGGDGRAVLRSSIREFLVSEAMHHLGVRTTRALSLVVSLEEAVQRPVPEVTANGRMQVEPCAITCRVAPSFLRVGHFELFGRRAANPPKGCGPAEQAVRSLEMLVDRALCVEFGGLPEAKSSAAARAWELLRHAAARVAETTAQWLRVGFCQGNFNSDNCLVSGRTMDYGPFGFVEQFDPRFGSWVGSGTHFSFMNQPQAGMMNLRSLTEALSPLLEEDEDKAWETVKAVYLQASSDAKVEVWRQKLGLQSWSSEAAGLLSDLLGLMEETSADWTITWRQLAACLTVPEGSSDEALLAPLISVQCNPCGIKAQADKWLQWLKRWVAMVTQEGSKREAAASVMRAASPKYVPREWMLKEAYEAAQQGEFSLVHELFEVFKQPYAEQESYEKRYYVCKPNVRIS